jgi:hypothetical protein
VVIVIVPRDPGASVPNPRPTTGSPGTSRVKRPWQAAVCGDDPPVRAGRVADQGDPPSAQGESQVRETRRPRAPRTRAPRSASPAAPATTRPRLRAHRRPVDGRTGRVHMSRGAGRAHGPLVPRRGSPREEKRGTPLSPRAADDGDGTVGVVQQ